MEETLEILKAEKQKIVSKFKKNHETECYGENCVFKTIEEYEKAMGLLVNTTASIQQFEQVAEMTRRNAEKIASMQQEAKEAK